METKQEYRTTVTHVSEKCANGTETSKFVPEYDTFWPREKRIGWFVGCVEYVTGIPIHVTDADFFHNDKRCDGYYNVQIGNGGVRVIHYMFLMEYLNGIQDCVEAIRRG